MTINTQQAEQYAQTLAHGGVVVIENYMPTQVCDELCRLIDDALEQRNFVERGELTLSDATAHEKPVLFRRGKNADAGMLDLLNVDQLDPRIAEFRNDSAIMDIVGRAAKIPYAPLRISAYVNRGIESTRGFHADTYKGAFKSFVYITDVPDESFGPYCFVRGSHHPSRVQVKARQLLNRIQRKPHTDAITYSESDVQVITAPRGTLIISNQAGLHRGLPQEPEKLRMLLSTALTPARSGRPPT